MHDLSQCRRRQGWRGCRFAVIVFHSRFGLSASFCKWHMKSASELQQLGDDLLVPPHNLARAANYKGDLAVYKHACQCPLDTVTSLGLLQLAVLLLKFRGQSLAVQENVVSTVGAVMTQAPLRAQPSRVYVQYVFSVDARFSALIVNQCSFYMRCVAAYGFTSDVQAPKANSPLGG